MEVAGAITGKSVLDGVLDYAKSAVAVEVALQLGIQRDHAFIRDELEMMQSFLMVAHEEQDEHKVIKTWVKQVRNVAYDVEDCLQDFAVRLRKPSWWLFPRMLLDRHRVATQMKELREKVEDVSQRNVRYRLIRGSGPKPSTTVLQSSMAGATMFGIEEARRRQEKTKVDLFQLINREHEDLSVIAVWGTSGVLGQTSIIKKAYDDLKRTKKFECYAWIRIMHPFDPLEFLPCIMRQFYVNSLEEAGETEATLGPQVLKKIEMMKQDDMVAAFNEQVRGKSYLIVLNELLTIEEWDWIKTYFPNNKKGGQIIVSAEQGLLASLCTGQENVVLELKQSYSDQRIYAFCDKKVFQDGIMLTKSRSSLNQATTTNVVPIDVITMDQPESADGTLVGRKSLTRIKTFAGGLEESQLIGREKEKRKIIDLIKYGQQIQVISVWGMGGLGKTTLVKEVFQNEELSGVFEKRACVTVIRPFILKELLKNLVIQLDVESSGKKGENIFSYGTRKEIAIMELEALTTELARLLKNMRCLIVLDDLSSTIEWDQIIECLPKMDNTSRIIVTTREENIAKHCSTKLENIYKLNILGDKEALELFLTKVFGKMLDLDEHYPDLAEEAKLILKKCDGLPLAIATIGGFLAKQPKSLMVWRKLNEHISAELGMNPELGTIRTVLFKSYDGLPYHLKPCFLYLSIFPADYNISQGRLVRRWIAEGYSSEVRGKSAREIADSYFMEFIDRSMILPLKKSIGSITGIDSCKVHDLMREVIISKSMEENLVFRMEEGCSSNIQGTVRHLSISSSSWKGDQIEFESLVDLSRIRSLTVVGKWRPFFFSDKMRLLRVLDLEGTSCLCNHHLEKIGKLLHLKYLSLRGCHEIYYLPASLGNMKELQTLDIRGTRIVKLPNAIINLTKLQYIRAGGPGSNASTFCFCVMFPLSARRLDPYGVVLPIGVKKLKALHTLGVVNIAGGKAILRDIIVLTQLRKLSVTGITSKNCPDFVSTLANLRCLETLSVHSEEPGLRGCLDGLSSPTKNLQSLELFCALVKVPSWVAGLQNLVKLKLRSTMLIDHDGAMKVLGELPNLTILRLWRESFYGQRLRLFFHQKAFPSLTVLELLLLDNLKLVDFKQGATPKLELLVFSGSTKTTNSRLFSGLSSLPKLKAFMLNYDDYKDNLVQYVQAELRQNLNRPEMQFYT